MSEFMRISADADPDAELRYTSSDDVPYPFNNTIENDGHKQGMSNIPENIMPSENSAEPQGETLHHTISDDNPQHITKAETGRSRYNLRKRR